MWVYHCRIWLFSHLRERGRASRRRRFIYYILSCIYVFSLFWHTSVAEWYSSIQDLVLWPWVKLPDAKKNHRQKLIANRCCCCCYLTRTNCDCSSCSGQVICSVNKKFNIVLFLPTAKVYNNNIVKMDRDGCSHR